MHTWSPSAMSSEIPGVSGGDGHRGWSGFEGGPKVSKTGPASWPEVAGRPRTRPTKGGREGEVGREEREGRVRREKRFPKKETPKKLKYPKIETFQKYPSNFR